MPATSPPHVPAHTVAEPTAQESAFERFVRWFRDPAELPPAERFRLRFIVGGCVVGLLASGVSVLQLLLALEHPGAHVLAVGVFAATLAGLLALLRRGWAPQSLVSPACGAITVYLVVMSVQLPGIRPQQLMWFAVVPLVGLVLWPQEGRAQAAWVPWARVGAFPAAGVMAVLLANHLGVSISKGEQTLGEALELADALTFLVSTMALVALHARLSQLAQEELQQLRGLLCVCAWCRKIKTDSNTWEPLERYVARHSDTTFTHGMCPSCASAQEDKG